MLHAENDPMRAGTAQYVAEHVADGRVVELRGYDHYPWFNDTTELAGQLEEFFTGVRTSTDVERVLTTVLLADIVDSTKHAANVGDRRWRELLDRFRERTRRELDRYRGHEINTRGDDFLATFDGPARGTRCAAAIASAGRALGVEVRAGLHTG